MGEHLVETRLAADLAMSRAPVREALLRLAKERLVEVSPHHGTFVTVLTAADVAHLYNVRLGLEVIALRLFMERESSTAPLWKAIGRMEHAAGQQDVHGVTRAELDFHRWIVERSGNPVLSELYTDFEGRAQMAVTLDNAAFERLDEVPAEHVPLVEAIERRDELHAAGVFEHHILASVGEALNRLGGDSTALLAPLRAGRRADSARSTQGESPTSTSTDGRHRRASGSTAIQNAAQREEPSRARQPAAAARSKTRRPKGSVLRTSAAHAAEDNQARPKAD